MRSTSYIGAMALGLILFSTACNKENVDDIDVRSARDHAKAEGYWNDLYAIVDEVSTNTEGIKSSHNCIDTLIVDTLSTPRSIIIDFGDSNCEGVDGRSRRGRIHITYSDRYRAEGAVITVSPQDYFIDDHGLLGTKTVTNMGRNEEEQMYFDIAVEDAQVIAPDEAWTIEWSSARTRTWVGGEETIFVIDDVYEISGTADGVNRNGRSFSMEITSPLVVAQVCPFIMGGTLELEPEDGFTRFVDYGDGSCDSEVTVTVNGDLFIFNL